MLFTTFDFLGFLAVVLTLFYILPRPLRRYLLLAASLFFYMAWKARFVTLILGLITIDYFAALWIVHKEGRQRRIALLVSLCANIGLLGYFKYTNFLRDIVGLHPLDIVLPLGIR